MRPIRKEILPDVFLNYLPASKFKNSIISIQMITPLEEKTAGANALLPAVLRRGTVRCPDMRRISSALDMLYGASVAYTVRKKGENQCVGFVGSFIDDAYTLDGEKLLEPMAQIMGELLLEPVRQNGCFLEEYVCGEKGNLIDAIRSIINDKRDYADMRLLQEMCRGERYGVDRLGREEAVRAITNASLYAHYRTMLSASRIEIFYCGKAELSRVEDALQSALAALPRAAVMPITEAVRVDARSAVQHIDQTLEVTQGKLSMGWRSDCDDRVAMTVCNTMFGGSSNSKLFLNVREKLSLCYYASTSYHRSKNLVTLSSGIECENYQVAFDEIMAQLDAVRRGEWEDWELTGARSTLISSMESMGDSIGRMEEYYLGQIATGVDETPEELIEAIRTVKPEAICAAAASLKLDTVYFLHGKEDEHND